jgi:hypothetical protein
MKITIEKNIPIPPKRTGLIHQLRVMLVGDSFLAEPKIRPDISRYAQRAGIKLCTRKEGGQIRIWRTE